MRIGTLSSLASLWVGCTPQAQPDETEAVPVETDDGLPDPGSPISETEAEQLYSLLPFPVTLLYMMMDTGNACPSVVEQDGGISVTTDCMDDEGTQWTGSAWMTGEEITWSLLTGTNLDNGTLVTVDGTQHADESTGVLTSNLTVTRVDDTFAGDIVFVDHSIDSHEFARVAWGWGGEYAVSGSMDFEGIGGFTIDGSVSDNGAEPCDREPDSGALTLSGDRNITYTHDGAVTCDGCIPTETEGTSASLCLWDWDEAP